MKNGFKTVKKILPKEKTIHRHLAEYLKLQYPGVIFRTDFSAGCKMTIGQAVQHKALQSGSAYPDVFIAEARHGYHGLYLELKRDVKEVFKKDGSLLSNPHIREQAAMMDRLNKKGYKALFACGFLHAKRVVDEYLKPIKTN